MGVHFCVTRPRSWTAASITPLLIQNPKAEELEDLKTLARDRI